MMKLAGAFDSNTGKNKDTIAQDVMRTWLNS